jgi:hypothetical protein
VAPKERIVKNGILAVLLAIGIALPAFAETNIQSYKEWKNEKIQMAVSQAMQARAHLLKAKAENNLSQRPNLEKTLEQRLWHLDIAKELSITDYFVLYLTPQNQPDRFKLAAQKLSVSEIAELMKAYAAELEDSESTPQPTNPAVTSRAMSGPKLPIQATQN